MDDEFDEFDQFDEEFGDEFPQPGQLRIVPVEAVVDASDFGHAALGSAGFSSGPADFDEFEQSFADFDLESRTNNAFQAPPAATAQASVGEEDGGAKGLRLDTGSATRQAAEQEDEQEEDEEPPTPAPEPAAPAFSSASLSTSEAPVPAPAAAAPAAAAAGKGRKDGRAEEADEDGIFFDQIGTSDYTGNLSKQLQKQWKKRICVLKGTVLYVFANQQSKALITIKLPGYKLTRLPDNGFKMVRGAKSHVFAADTPAEQQTWMRLIYVAAVAPEDNFISGGVGDKVRAALAALSVSFARSCAYLAISRKRRQLARLRRRR